MTLTRPKLTLGLALLTAVVVPLALADVPDTNPAGVNLVRESNVSPDTAEQANGLGVKLLLVSLPEDGIDTTNTGNVTAFMGLLDNGLIQRNAAGVSWTLYEAPTAH